VCVFFSFYNTTSLNITTTKNTRYEFQHDRVFFRPVSKIIFLNIFR